ncbi:hypothetical protein Ddc_10034 [Ditylenchus destructor]|nr:hypothetical protein Ddc_10034 [Ditylenchus destructor]
MPIEYNFTFALKWPYGVLKTAQWVGPLLTLCALHSRAYDITFLTYFAIIISYVFFLYSLVVWGLHAIGVTQVVGPPPGYNPNDGGDDYSSGERFANLDLWASVIGAFCFATIALLSFVALFCNTIDGSSIKLPVMAYVFSLIFSIATAACFGYNGHLLRRALSHEYQPLL